METTTNYTLITGGSMGIGFSLAKVFARNGHNLIIVARDEDELNTAATELRNEGDIDVITIVRDLFDPENAFALYDEIKERNLTVDILVNNAGQGLYGEFADTDIWQELKIVQLNISSMLVLTKAFLEDMLDRGEGRILNLSSIASKMPGPWQSVYHGTKAFVQSFTEALRAEVNEKGITVTALLPGGTDTDFFNKAGMQDSKLVQEGKLADPDEVAQDGYDALMSGDDKVISGFKNKMQVTMSNALPDSTVAKKMYKQQAPVDQEKKSL
jgi:short-subunit dehydrogenase